MSFFYLEFAMASNSEQKQEYRLHSRQRIARIEGQFPKRISALKNVYVHSIFRSTSEFRKNIQSSWWAGGG